MGIQIMLHWMSLVLAAYIELPWTISEALCDIVFAFEETPCYILTSSFLILCII